MRKPAALILVLTFSFAGVNDEENHQILTLFSDYLLAAKINSLFFLRKKNKEFFAYRPPVLIIIKTS